MTRNRTFPGAIAILVLASAVAHGGNEVSASAAPAAPGAVYNLKVLSDKTVDLTDLKSFCHDATARWPANDEKAAAIAHWLGVLGNQSGPLYDWMPVEPVLQLNTTTAAQCAYWTGLYIAIAEGGMGWIGRHYEVGDHTVPELEYGGKRHYLDNTYKFFPVACDGRTIISITDMDEEAGPCARGPRCRFHNLLYHTPQALCPDLDGYVRDKEGNDSTPIRAWLSGSWLRREAAGRAYFAVKLDEEWVKKCWQEHVTESCHSMYRCLVNLRDRESYTRYWDPVGDTPDCFYPNENGEDPDRGLNDRGRGNGVWEFEPDLASGADLESVTGVVFGRDGIRPAERGQEGTAVFKVDSANITTGCTISAEAYRKGMGDRVIIEASYTAGNSWFPVWSGSATGRISVREDISDRLKGSFAGKDLRVITDFLVRVRMTAKGSAGDSVLNRLRIRTVTMLNRNSLPKLGLGSNRIAVDQDAARQDDTISLRPVLKGDRYREYAVDHAKLGSGDKQGSWQATLYANDPKAEGHATFRLETPRPIRRIRMGGSIWIGGPPAGENYVRYEYRLWNDAWSEWVRAGLFNWDTRDNYHGRRNQTKYLEIPVSIPRVTRIEFRFVFRSGSGSPQGAGANAIRMEADYAPAYQGFRPVAVTYNWTEYYEPLPTGEENGGTTRSHTEIVDRLPYAYQVNTGGDIAPRMNWVRMALADGAKAVGFGLRQASLADGGTTTGYSDGRDVGGRYAIPSLHYECGKLLSFKKVYSVLPDPARDEFHAVGDEHELTDGVVKEPQVEGPWPDTCLVRWPADTGTVFVTVDLGSVTEVGGARVDAFYRPQRDRFPESVVVETSKDGKRFSACARDRWGSAKYAHNGWPADWPLNPRHDSPKWGEFPNYGLRGNYIFIPFDKPVKARFVRFVVVPQPSSGVMLSEVHVWDRLEAVDWTPRLAHEGN